MNNKFENVNEEEKLFKKRLLDRTLPKNTGLDLCLSIYIKTLVYIFIKFLIIKARLKKHFGPSFPENIIQSSTHHTLIRFQF